MTDRVGHAGADSMAMQATRQTVDLLGVRIDVLDRDGLCDRVLSLARHGRLHQVMYVNTDCMLIVGRNSRYRQVLNKADLVYADGIGVVHGVRLWGQRLPGRMTAADFMPDFCRIFADHGLRIYLLGSAAGVAEEAADRLCRQVPGLRIVGVHHGYFRQEEQAGIIADINGGRVDILLVGLGAPYQEFWIEENAAQLEVGLVWGVGGLFDFLSGRTRRGPRLLLDHGFEWLCRLMVEPRRLWRRYLVGNTIFVARLLWQRFVVRRRIPSRMDVP